MTFSIKTPASLVFMWVGGQSQSCDLSVTLGGVAIVTFVTFFKNGGNLMQSKTYRALKVLAGFRQHKLLYQWRKSRHFWRAACLAWKV